jgi:hypothetical protein
MTDKEIIAMTGIMTSIEGADTTGRGITMTDIMDVGILATSGTITTGTVDTGILATRSMNKMTGIITASGIMVESNITIETGSKQKTIDRKLKLMMNMYKQKRLLERMLLLLLILPLLLVIQLLNQSNWSMVITKWTIAREEGGKISIVKEGSSIRRLFLRSRVMNCVSSC